MDFLEDVFLTQNDISDRVKSLGKEITNDYKDKNLLLVSILKGSILFLSDLMREIKINNCEVDFMCVSSYVGTKSGGTIKVLKDLNTDISNSDVLIVEDIIESGYTLNYVSKIINDKNPKSLKICALLDKPECHKLDVKADYRGFEVPNKFVIGYGMDYNEKYRNLPFIGILNRRYI